MQSGKLLTIPDAAEYLGGVSKWTVHAWLSQGKLRRTKVGARTMIREADLQAFIESCNPEPATPAGAKANPAPIPPDNGAAE